MVVGDLSGAAAFVEAVDSALERGQPEGSFDLGEDVGDARGSFVARFGFLEEILAAVGADDEDFAGLQFGGSGEAGLRPARAKAAVGFGFRSCRSG